MITYNYVEDYLELLAGYDPASTHAWIILNNKQISLARYDVNIVDSMSEHTIFGGALTDRQAELCVKIILKYRKQFAKIGVDVSPVETPVFRLPPRKLDRSRRIWLDGARIGIRFPYDRELIDSINVYKKDSQGSARWDNDEKVWWFGLTEANVNWAVAWGETWKIDIDPKVRDLYNKILLAETEPYEIKLVQRDGWFEIVNAAESLVNYVEEKLGGFGLDNVTRLVDSAGVLGYTVDRGIKYDELLDLFGPDRLIHVPSTESGSLDLIFDYAELTDRWPVYIYNPGTSQSIDLDRFNENEIVKFDPAGKTKTPDYNFWTTKVIYVNKIPKVWEWPIPLLVSTVEMMYGGSRMDWMTRAEKVIHYSYVPLREKN